MEEFLKQVLKPQDVNEQGPFALEYVLTLFSHSFCIGVILVLATFLPAYLNAKEQMDAKRLRELILGSSNIIYICVGLTGIMILVNNNLARAFAIGAALALVRFRIKLGQKSAGSNLLFGIMAGIACGLNELNVAWLSVAWYIVLQTLVYMTLRKIRPDS